MGDTDDEHRAEDLARRGLDDELGERPAEPGLRSPASGVRVGERRRARAGGIAQQQRITVIELSEETAHEARRLGRWAQPVVNPLALPQPLDQSGFTEDPQVTRNPRLALPKGLRDIRDAERCLRTEGEQTQTRRLAGCAQPLDETLGRRPLHLNHCTSLS